MAWHEKFSDDFTDSDGVVLPTHDATWIADHYVWDILSNQGRAYTTNKNCVVRCSQALGDDQAAEYELLYNPGGQWSGVGIRYTYVGGGGDDRNQSYFLLINGTTFRLYRRDTSSWVSLGTVSYDPVGQVIRIEAEGNNFKCYANAVQKLGPISDATYGSGVSAMRGYGRNAVADDFFAYDTVAPGVAQAWGDRIYRMASSRGGERISGVGIRG
jgi:hypothetical protein